MAALQAQQLAWQQENLAARLAGLKAAASQSELNQALKARASGARAVGLREVRNAGPRLAGLRVAAMHFELQQTLRVPRLACMHSD